MAEYTTVAITDDDKERLDEFGERHVEGGNPSYRTIINFLVDEYENRQDDYEAVLARAIARADEDDASRIIRRVNSDKEFVENLNNDE